MLSLRAIIKASAVAAAIAGSFSLAQSNAVAIPHLTAETAAPIYMKCDGFTKGADSPKGHDWIEVSSFSFGQSNTSTIGSATGGAGAGKVKFNEFTIKKTTDKASPVFFKAFHSGQHDSCTVNFDRQNTSETQPFMTFHMENVMISSYHVSSGGDRPTESISFNFTKIEFKDNVHPSPSPTTGSNTTGGTLVPGTNLTNPSPSPSPRVKPQ
jgi:type VI secretion system secreted protein Hcp